MSELNHLLYTPDDEASDPTDMGIEAPSTRTPPLSAILHSETPNGARDLFLTGIYRYYTSSGFLGFILSSALPLLVMQFVTFILLFFFCFVDYSTLGNTANLWESTDFSISNITWIFWIFIGVVAIITTIRLISLISEIPLFWEIRRVYLVELNLPSLAHVEWTEVIRRLHLRYSLLTPTVVVSSIMRRDNYNILFFSRQPLPWVATRYSLLFEWCLTRSVWDVLLDQTTLQVLTTSNISEDLTNVLKKRARYMGLITLITVPILLIYLLVYYFLAYFERIRSSPAFLTDRMFTRVALYYFREYNELPIYFQHRLQKSVKYLQKYFSMPKTSLPYLLLDFTTFLVGSLVAVLLAVGLFHNSLLNSQIWGYSLLSVTTILAVLYVSLRSSLSQVKSRTGRNQINNKRIRYLTQLAEILKYVDATSLPKYYLYRMIVFGWELWNLLWVPYLFLVKVPNAMEELIRFVRENTRYIEGIGYICRAADFSSKLMEDGRSEGRVEGIGELESEDLRKMYSSMVSFRQIYS